MRRALSSMALAVAALGGTEALAQVDVTLPSLDKSDGSPVMLTGQWFAAKTSANAPAVVLLHGCGGAYDARGQLSERMRDYAALLNGVGVHTLVVDSLNPRGQKQICTQKFGTRSITQAKRRLDALGALQWLATQPQVDVRRLGLIGWSNGGSTVLATTNLRNDEATGAAIKPAFAVAFYPGCAADLKRGYRTDTKLLLMVGEADDWTPAAPCRQLAEQAAGIKPQFDSYAGAYHGFDSTAPLRVRKDVPNGINPGQGVTVGGNPEALLRSRERLLKFLAEQGISH
ncbi:MAG TPA: dienelactone hydrolase family protein [Albitalea sp.]|nr:dienelactone hydrolase family protein [Albitalea sp.]